MMQVHTQGSGVAASTRTKWRRPRWPRSSSSRRTPAFRCRPAMEKVVRSDVQPGARDRADDRAPRGDFPASRAPDARAPALRAGARPGRRGDPRRVRRRPAAAARRRSTSTSNEPVEQFPRGREKEPEQTLAFRRVLQTAVLHVQSAGRSEVRAGDVLAAALQQTKSYAASCCRPGRHAPRHPELHLARHPEGAGRAPRSPHGEPRWQRCRRRLATMSPAVARDPLAAYAVNLTERARGGLLDPLIGRQQRAAAHDGGALPPAQEQPGVRRRCRRRARPRWPRGSRSGCSQTTCPRR